MEFFAVLLLLCVGSAIAHGLTVESEQV